MVSIQEIHFYNNLVKNQQVSNLIFCPINNDDIIVTKVDKYDKPYFYCISCKTIFRLTSEIQEVISATIKKFI